jgi:hypothetical protein
MDSHGFRNRLRTIGTFLESMNNVYTSMDKGIRVENQHVHSNTLTPVSATSHTRRHMHQEHISQDDPVYKLYNYQR